MNRKLKTFVAVIALLLGIACLVYPVISNIIIGRAQEQVAKENVVNAQNTDADTIHIEHDRAVAYNQALLAGRTHLSDPFDPDNQNVGGMDYRSILNLTGNGVMATLSIPSADIYVPVYHGTSDRTLDQGAGHLLQSSLPVGGPDTHCIIAGHTGLPSVRIFDNLRLVDVGDYICLNTLGEELYYRVNKIEVVLPEDLDSLAIEQGKDLLTLVTCTPYGINTHRLLVHAERCDAPTDDEAAAAHSSGKHLWIYIACAAIALLAVIILIVSLVKRRRRKKWLFRTSYGAHTIERGRYRLDDNSSRRRR